MPLKIIAGFGSVGQLCNSDDDVVAAVLPPSATRRRVNIAASALAAAGGVSATEDALTTFTRLIVWCGRRPQESDYLVLAPVSAYFAQEQVPGRVLLDVLVPQISPLVVRGFDLTVAADEEVVFYAGRPARLGAAVDGQVLLSVSDASEPGQAGGAGWTLR